MFLGLKCWEAWWFVEGQMAQMVSLNVWESEHLVCVKGRMGAVSQLCKAECGLSIAQQGWLLEAGHALQVLKMGITSGDEI